MSADLALRSSMLENSTRLDSTRFESNKNFAFEKSSRTGNLCSRVRVEPGVMLDRKFRVRVEQIGLLDRCSTRNARNVRKVNPQQCPPCLYGLFASRLNHIVCLLIVIQYSDTAVLPPSMIISQLRLYGRIFRPGAANPVFPVSENDTPSILAKCDWKLANHSTAGRQGGYTCCRGR